MKRFLYTFAYLVLLGIPGAILSFFVQIDYKALLLTVLVTLIVGGVFDIWAVKQKKTDKFFIWEYNSKSILGFKFYGAPIEDFVFFLVLTPLFLVAVYETSKLVLSIKSNVFIPIIIVATFTLLVSYYLIYLHAIKSKW